MSEWIDNSLFVTEGFTVIKSLKTCDVLLSENGRRCIRGNTRFMADVLLKIKQANDSHHYRVQIQTYLTPHEILKDSISDLKELGYELEWVILFIHAFQDYAFDLRITWGGQSGFAKKKDM